LICVYGKLFGVALRPLVRRQHVGQMLPFAAKPVSSMPSCAPWRILLPMNLTLAHIGVRPAAKDKLDAELEVAHGKQGAKKAPAKKPAAKKLSGKKV